MKVALVHDWLVTYGGAEKVLEEIVRLFPDADLFSVVEFVPEEQRSFLGGRKVRTSFIQGLPGARRHYRRYLPLMPLAIEQFDLSDYDLVISSSYAVAKGVITGPDQLHISYVHSPMRYAWDLQHQYLRETKLDRGVRSWFARMLLHYLRLWDVRTAVGIDVIVANSDFVARRIRKAYGREAVVIHPPVDTSAFVPVGKKEDFYLTASRLVPYKRVDLIAEAFALLPDRRLIIVGDGPERERIARVAGSNITMLGYVDVEELRSLMARARAFVFAAEEDFGIVPLEAQACGTPVIAYGRGGVLETVRGLGELNPTGVFFERQNVEDLVAAVRTFEESEDSFESAALFNYAAGFSQERFRDAFMTLINKAIAAHLSG